LIIEHPLVENLHFNFGKLTTVVLHAAWPCIPLNYWILELVLRTAH